MIDKSELMCNDWVLVSKIDRIPFKVIGLREECAELQPHNGMPFLAPYKDLEPLPIFNEFLALNEIEPFSIYVACGEVKNVDDFKHVIGGIKSVHALQNCLRLMGKKDKADGFRLPFKDMDSNS